MKEYDYIRRFEDAELLAFRKYQLKNKSDAARAVLEAEIKRRRLTGRYKRTKLRGKDACKRCGSSRLSSISHTYQHRSYGLDYIYFDRPAERRVKLACDACGRVQDESPWLSFILAAVFSLLLASPLLIQGHWVAFLVVFAVLLALSPLLKRLYGRGF